MNDRIQLTGIEVLARHGVLEAEHDRAQIFRVDVTAYLDLTEPAQSDRISDTLDYSVLAVDVREVVGSESHGLIEKVASRVCDVVFRHPQVERCTVTIHKPEAPLDVAVEDVSVTLERSR